MKTLAILVVLTVCGCTGPDPSAKRRDSVAAAAEADRRARDSAEQRARDTSSGSPLTHAGPMRVAATQALRRDGDAFTAAVHYEYTNHTGAPVYLVNCNGDISPSVQRFVDGRWEYWWSPMMNACLSPPVVIEPGVTIRDTLMIWIAPHDRPYADVLSAPDTARYRLIWHQALTSFDATAGDFGPKVATEHRVSNPFALRLAD